jgi:hypothetical protein
VFFHFSLLFLFCRLFRELKQLIVHLRHENNELRQKLKQAMQSTHEGRSSNAAVFASTSDLIHTNGRLRKQVVQSFVSPLIIILTLL